MKVGVKKGMGVAGFIALIGAFIGLHEFASNYDFKQALRYPERRLGFVWKKEFENNFDSCLAENNPEHYDRNSGRYSVREFCVYHSHAVPGRDFGGGDVEYEECRFFRINLDCIDHFVEPMKR